MVLNFILKRVLFDSSISDFLSDDAVNELIKRQRSGPVSDELPEYLSEPLEDAFKCILSGGVNGWGFIEFFDLSMFFGRRVNDVKPYLDFYKSKGFKQLSDGRLVKPTHFGLSVSYSFEGKELSIGMPVISTNLRQYFVDLEKLYKTNNVVKN